MQLFKHQIYFVHCANSDPWPCCITHFKKDNLLRVNFFGQRSYAIVTEASLTEFSEENIDIAYARGDLSLQRAIELAKKHEVKVKKREQAKIERNNSIFDITVEPIPKIEDSSTQHFRKVTGQEVISNISPVSPASPIPISPEGLSGKLKKKLMQTLSCMYSAKKQAGDDQAGSQQAGNDQAPKKTELPTIRNATPKRENSPQWCPQLSDNQQAVIPFSVVIRKLEEQPICQPDITTMPNTVISAESTPIPTLIPSPSKLHPQGFFSELAFTSDPNCKYNLFIRLEDLISYILESLLEKDNSRVEKGLFELLSLLDHFHLQINDLVYTRLPQRILVLLRVYDLTPMSDHANAILKLKEKLLIMNIALDKYGAEGRKL